MTERLEGMIDKLEAFSTWSISLARVLNIT